MPGPLFRRKRRRICGWTGRGQTDKVCAGGGLQGVSFWEKSLKGGPRGTLWGARQEKGNPQGSGERQIPLPFKENIEPNKFPSEQLSIWSV